LNNKAGSFSINIGGYKCLGVNAMLILKNIFELARFS
jgi:hypothetical protein